MKTDIAQPALNTAYFAFAADPTNKALATAYDAARSALWQALNTHGGEHVTKLKWQFCSTFDSEKSYCADGDGIVYVALVDSRWAVFEQGDEVASYIAIDEAFILAEKILAEDYPAIYADCVL